MHKLEQWFGNIDTETNFASMLITVCLFMSRLFLLISDTAEDGGNN
jgi:hypothetical protein